MLFLLGLIASPLPLHLMPEGRTAKGRTNTEGSIDRADIECNRTENEAECEKKRRKL